MTQQLNSNSSMTSPGLKPNPPPNLSCRYYTHATETTIGAPKNKKSRHTFNYDVMRAENGGKQMKGAWTFPPRSTEKRFGKHPAQKPVDLLDRIIPGIIERGFFAL